MSFFDFNDAEQQQSFDLIPKGTLVKIHMRLKPGGYDDPSQGWTGGWASQGFDSGSVYLACEAVILDGPYARRKLWWNVGLYSPKGPTWGNMGRTFIRAALNSARGIHPGDNSPQAQTARRIQGFGELDGLEFAVRIDIEKDGRGEDRNTVKSVLEPDHKDYLAVMGGHIPAAAPMGQVGMATPTAASYAPPQQPAAAAPRPAPAVPTGKPAWAQ